MSAFDLSHAAWRKSTYSGTNGACLEVTLLGGSMVWCKSSHSGANGSCVEVARHVPGVVAVRDSKDPGGPALAFRPHDWQVFTERVRAGELG